MMDRFDWPKIPKSRRGHSLVILGCSTVFSILLLYNQHVIKHSLGWDYSEAPDLRWVRDYARGSQNELGDYVEEDGTRQDCTSRLDTYERQRNGAGNHIGWAFCEDTFEILTKCVKSSELYAHPLPNFYLRDTHSDVKDKAYSEAHVAFVHLPKSGGTSVEAFLLPIIANSGVFRFSWTQFGVAHCHEFADAALKLSQSTTRLLFYSKRTYGLHTFALQTRPFLYLTWLRDPIDRTVSAYYYIRKMHPTYHVLYDMYVRNSKNLTDFLIKTKNIRITEFDNHFVRLLQFGSYPDVDYSFEDCCGGELNPANVVEIREEHYLTAKKNLEKNFAFVGITEEFKLSQDMLSYVLGKPAKQAEVRVNTNHHKTVITEFERKELERRNYWDIKLYDDAIRIFEMQKRKYMEIYDQLAHVEGRKTNKQPEPMQKIVISS
ncbi:uncharacterized protein LOC144435917 [Glandiceps talaboti]